MPQISIELDEIKRNLSVFFEKLERGDSIVITKDGSPMAKIEPVATSGGQRPFGLCHGDFTVPADFDDPLPEDVIEEFEG